MQRYSPLNGLLFLTMVLSPGCIGNGPPEKVTSPAAAPVPGSRPQVDARVDLKAALLPPPRAQQVRIHLVEHRTTVSPQTDSATADLELELQAMLRPGKTEPDGIMRAVLEFTHTSLRMGTPAEPASMLSYDSMKDKAGKGNALADLMAVVAGAKLALRIAPDGRLLELRGLDAKWRAAGIVMAPPGLLAAQWLFRDNSMRELVSEALFPPMPASANRAGDTWKARMPANIPLAAQLTSNLRFELRSTMGDGGASGGIRIQAAGQIQPTEPVLKDAPPAIQPVVKSASHVVQMLLNPESRHFRQESTRNIDLGLTLIPPSGDDRLKMDLRQARQLKAERFPVENGHQ